MNAFFTLPRPDGAALHVHAFRAREPRAMLLVVHGMAEHGARYARFAERANAAGLSVFAPDLRGHGRTASSPAELGHMGDRDAFALTCADLEALIAHLRMQEGDLPLAILGHSMGSFIVQEFLARAPKIFAAVFSGSTGKPPLLGQLGRLLARAERLRLGPRGKSPLLHALTFKDYNSYFAPCRTDADWLSRDEAEVDAYVRDPLCGFECSTGTWIGLLDTLALRLARAKLARWPRVPVLIVGGDQDAVSEYGKGLPRLRDTLQRAGLEVSAEVFPGGRHEMLNEIVRDEVEIGIVSFLERALVREPQRA